MKANSFFALVFFILMATIYCQGQTIVLTFTAEHDGSHVALESISIENLTQGGDTALFAPDTVLVLDYLTSTEEINIDRNDGLFVSQNYPNPFTDKTSFRVEIREKSINTITIHDIYGREIIQSIRELDAGIHYFEFIQWVQFFFSIEEDFYVLHQARSLSRNYVLQSKYFFYIQ